MTLNFFDVACQESPLENILFGICDGQKGVKAYTDVNNSSAWIATVKNEARIKLTFTAIDKCVIKDHELRGKGRCDGMLYSNEHLYFIELKDQSKNWISEAIEQLESTIQFFIAHHDIKKYKHKKAFVCNKRRRHFQEIDNELNLRFFRAYGVRIDVQAEIIVIAQ